MAVKKKKPAGSGSKLPLLKQPGDIGYDAITAPEVAYEGIDPTDTTFNFDQIGTDDISADQISAGTVTGNKVTAGNLANQIMTSADYTLIDPADIASEYGDINRSEIKKNANLSSELALDALNTELSGLKNFAPAAANLKRQELAADNTFNQAERKRQLESGDPNLTSDLEAQRLRSTAYAEGRVPDSIQDRALELGIQSRSTDAAAASGFGVRSQAAAKASQLLSAQERIGLSQYGDQLLTSNIGNRANLLLAPTQYSDAGAQIKVTPTQSAGQNALAIASEANAGNITAKEALASKSQQGQFKTTIEQDTAKTNVTLAAERDLNQARLDIEADEFTATQDFQAQTTNVGNALTAAQSNQQANLSASTSNAANRLSAATSNADNAIRTQIAGKQIQSEEKQFNSQLKFNTANSNADRNFQASNANAGRALEVATSNRAVKLEVDKTNQTMKFQDQQARKAEAAASARAAAAERGASARAAMSAATQSQKIAADAQMQRDNFAFQLEQQRRAGEAYQHGQDSAHTSQNWATVGTVISRAPTVIAGVGAVVDYFTDDSPSPSGGNDSTDTSGWDHPLTESAPDFSYDSGSSDLHF